MAVLMKESDFQKLLQSLVDLVNGISALGDTIKLYRKDCAQLIRRIKLLALPDDVVLQFRIFKDVLSEAKQLLHLCHDGSKLYMKCNGKEQHRCWFFQRSALCKEEGADNLAPGLQKQIDETLEEITPRCMLEILAYH